MLLLLGPDGANPLGFLTALGTLRTLSCIHREFEWKLGWQIEGGRWRPYIESNGRELDSASLSRELAAWLHEPPQLPLLESDALGDNLTIAPETFRKLARNFLEEIDGKSSNAVIALDFLAAFGTDATHQPHSKDRKLMQDTALRTMSGAGHQHFLKFMREIIENTTADHIYSTLFAPWSYQDEGRGMNLRWDPIDDRRYAMRWKNPSSDAAVSMRGANRLAIEALPLFPTAPMGTELVTTGFRHRRGTFWSWPIWQSPLDLNVIQSVLQLAAVSELDRDAAFEELRIRGITTIYRSQRITVGKFRNFTPAVSI